MCGFLLGDDEAESGREKGPGHVGEGEEEEGAASPGVNGPDRGPGEDEIDETEAEGGEERVEIGGAGVDEDGRGVEGDDVDAAHLLGQHDCEGGTGRAADTGDGEEFDEAGDVVAAADDVGFFLDLSVDVVEITGGLERGVSETAQRTEGVCVSALFDVPPRRFRAEVDTDE